MDITKRALTIIVAILGGLTLFACSGRAPISDADLLSEAEVQQAVGSSNMTEPDLPADVIDSYIRNGVTGPCTGTKYWFSSNTFVGRIFLQEESNGVLQIVAEVGSDAEDLVNALSAELGEGCILDLQLPDGSRGVLSGTLRPLDLGTAEGETVGWASVINNLDGPTTYMSTAFLYREGRLAWLEVGSLEPHDHEAVILNLLGRFRWPTRR